MSENRDEKKIVVDAAAEGPSTPAAQRKLGADIADSENKLDATHRLAPPPLFSNDVDAESELELPSDEAMGLTFPESPDQKTAAWDLDEEPEPPPSSVFGPISSERDASGVSEEMKDRDLPGESAGPEGPSFTEDRALDPNQPSDGVVSSASATTTAEGNPDHFPTETVRNLEDLVATLDGEMESSYGPLLGPDVESAASGAETEVNKERYLLFTLDRSFWAVPIGAIVEVESVPAITSVPNVPSWVLGVANMRGDIVSVVDFKELLGLDATLAPERGRIVIGKSTREGIVVGLVVDDVNGFVRLANDDVSTPSAHGDSVVTPYLLGVCEHKDALVSILDLGRFLDSRSVRQFEPT